MSKRASGGGMGVFERQRHFLAAAARLENSGGDEIGEQRHDLEAAGAAGVGSDDERGMGMWPRREVALWRVWVTRWVPVTRGGGGSGGLLEPRWVVGRVTGVVFCPHRVSHPLSSVFSTVNISESKTESRDECVSLIITLDLSG
jgi:hypothetical protein